MAKHLNLLICEGTLDAIFVPPQTIFTELIEAWLIVECLLRIHEERVGFSVVAKVSELEGEKVILTVVSTYPWK